MRSQVLKTGLKFSAEDWQFDIAPVSKVVDIIELWNKEKRANHTIRVNVPGVCYETGHPELMGSKNLVENFIENYTKFNSNTVSEIEMSSACSMVNLYRV